MRASRFFEPHNWEHKGYTYTRFGIRYFRPYVAGGRFWQSIQSRITGRRTSGKWKKSNVAQYARQSVVAESAHWASLLFLLFVTLLFVQKGMLLDAFVISVFNIIINFLPIGVLRYNRLRILSRKNLSPVSIQVTS